ncbi:sensor domain-containing protein [Undibacterium parvum]|uniref:EAL domain-containing protein n=1 Tax=Undibacterium parvum TaxID=401471 RepID=A0A3S9HKK0_9BURK|nr:GGDEF and EAL domain-containing protein [Undibacterium parvum]AZP12633.1 EAL domain-containing protein [Undibacterium parvum]
MSASPARPFQEDTAQLLALLNALPMCVSFLDAQFRYQFINHTYLKWFQLTPEQVLGKLLPEVIGTAAFDLVRPYVAQAMAGHNTCYQARIPYLSGGARDINAQLLPVFSEAGTVLGCYAILEDISEKKISEHLNHEQEQRWQLALESAGDGVWDWYPQTGIEIFSKRLKEIYGYGEDEIADLSNELDRRTHPDDLLQMRLDRQAHFDGITPIYTNEHRVQCKDGAWKWILTRGTVIVRDAQGQPVRVIGTHTDISVRKHAEAALRQSEERLRLALAATHQGLYDLDIRSGIAIVNPEYASMLGFDHANFHESNEAWKGRIHPDDKEAITLAYQNYLNGKSAEYRVEYRQKKKNGEYIWILTVGAIVEYDAQNRPLRMLGTHLDITEKKKSEALIWRQANIDALTGLPNRRMFYDRLEHDIQKSRRSGLPLAVFFIDLDHFKEVNDTLGHAIGDALLVEAAQRLQACVRASDTVARLGGDEFTVSLPDQHDPDHVEAIAQNIIAKMAQPFHLGNEEIYLSASIGITVYPNDAQNLENLLKHADQAMYAAKESGRNRFSYFTSQLQTAALARMRLTSELRTAIAEQQLEVHFQAIVSLASGTIDKAEALIRWQHPQLGMISPVEFIPIAESCGLITQIGDYVFQQALLWIKKWRSRYQSQFQISINQSPMEFQSDTTRYLNWVQQLHQQGLPGQAICIEITEGLLLDASTKISQKLGQLRDAGIQVALDDFGTGYSSLSYLKKFKIDYLKIDQSFIRNLSSDESDLALSEAIIVMAHKLGLKVVAEGVESASQSEILSAAGCDFAQGYLFAKPMPAEQFEMLLQQQQKNSGLRQNCSN